MTGAHYRYVCHADLLPTVDHGSGRMQPLPGWGWGGGKQPAQFSPTQCLRDTQHCHGAITVPRAPGVLQTCTAHPTKLILTAVAGIASTVSRWGAVLGTRIIVNVDTPNFPPTLCRRHAGTISGSRAGVFGPGLPCATGTCHPPLHTPIASSRSAHIQPVRGGGTERGRHWCAVAQLAGQSPWGSHGPMLASRH